MAEKTPDNMTLLDKMSSEVTPATSPLLEFLTKNAKKIAIVMAVCFVAAGGYTFHTWNEGKKAAAAQEELARILILDDSADKLAKLKAFIPGAPESTRVGTTLVLARTAMKIKDYAEATQAWDTLAKDPGSHLYATAMIGKAESLSLQNKAAEALAVLEGINLPADSGAIGLVNVYIADLAERTGNYDKAIAACEKIISGPAAANPEEVEFWRQKAASLRIAAKS